LNALGVCGADLDMLRSIKQPVTDIDYGFVGDITAVNDFMALSAWGMPAKYK